MEDPLESDNNRPKVSQEFKVYKLMTTKKNVDSSKTVVVICSFCSKKIKVTQEQISRRARCPGCGKAIRLYANQNSDITRNLASTWYYTKSKMFILQKDVGPISDEEFLRLVAEKTLVVDSDVCSPELTTDEWCGLTEHLIIAVQEIVNQRRAESQRVARIQDRKAQIAKENNQRIRKLIRGAIADGVLTSTEQSQIQDFAHRAKIDPTEVTEILRSESHELIEQLIEESLDDGILEPDEERKIAKHAKGLGVSLKFDARREAQIELCRFAWQLNHSTPADLPEISVDFSIGKTEFCIAKGDFEWNEIVKLKRPKGIPLGDDRYLKSIGNGACYLTDKQVLLVTPYESKKIRLSSIGKVEKHRDGVFLNRTTGNSVFLRNLQEGLENQRFSLMLDWIVSGVVQAVFVDQNFVPEATESISEVENVLATSDYREPRFTFRVVGDHVDDRSHWISLLGISDRLYLIREPDNPHDENAVMVFDAQRHMLGYLKRDVAEWFGPRMDSGVRSEAEVHRIRNDGALIVGVYE